MKSNNKVLRNVALLCVVAVVLILLSVSFTASGINDRAIIIGIGIDYDTDSEQFVTTFELVSASSSAEQSGQFSKLLTVRSDTIDSAIHQVYSQTGRKASLGQCQLLILGNSLYTSNHLLDVLPYFTINDEYKDSSSVTCVSCEAHDIMQTQLPMNNSISFTLSQLLKDASKQTGMVATTTSRLVQSALQIGGNQQISLVEYIEQTEPSSGEGEALPCSYMSDSIVVLDNFDYVCTLSSLETKGYSLIADKIIGQYYTVSNDDVDIFDSKQLGVAVTSKNNEVSVLVSGDKAVVSVEVELCVQSVRHYDVSRGGKLHPLVSRQLTEVMLNDVKCQSECEIQAFINASKQYDVDIIGIYKKIELNYNDIAEELAQQLSVTDMQFDVLVSVVED